jgi:hypothetical protein
VGDSSARRVSQRLNARGGDGQSAHVAELGLVEQGSA